MNTARANSYGYGTQGAGNVVGGGTPGEVNNYETYNGTSYANGPTLQQARFGIAAAGTSTAGLAFGGYHDPGGTSGSTLSETYNGSSWSEGNNLNTARYDALGFGSATAAVAAGGHGSTAISNTEEYNGTAWTAGNSLPATHRVGGASGTLTAGVIFGGLVAESDSGISLLYDGTNWSSTATMATARRQLGGSSAAPSSLRFSTVEEFDQKIRGILNYTNRNNYYSNIKKLRQIGEKRILELEPNIGSHTEALNTPWGSDERNFLKQWN
jgi:hypothetical protein